MTPLFVLPGVEPRWKKRSGKFEIPADFLPKPKYLYMRKVAGVDTNIFENWAQQFVDETQSIRRGNKKILIVMDGYSCHISFKTLSLFRENGIVVACLPAHTSHVFQPLDVGVFSSLKEEFRRLLGRRTVFSKHETSNDIFTISESLCKAYQKCVVAHNIIGGFDGSGLWGKDEKDVDPTKITEQHFNSYFLSEETVSALPPTRRSQAIVMNSDDNHQQIETFQELHKLFLRNAEALVSDGIVEESGKIYVSTASGATLTSDNVLVALRAREER